MRSGLRLVMVYLFALGLDLLCSPVGCFFRVGNFVAGSGYTAGLLLSAVRGSASFFSGRPVSVLLEIAPPFPPTVRSPILFQRDKSILAGVPGWWLMRLYQSLESSGGRSGGWGFDCVSGVQLGGSEQASETNRSPGKMNMSHRVLFVIFIFLGSCL
ncbi:unnamed protein product [Urochloa humidicola]